MRVGGVPSLPSLPSEESSGDPQEDSRVEQEVPIYRSSKGFRDLQNGTHNTDPFKMANRAFCQPSVLVAGSALKAPATSRKSA